MATRTRMRYTQSRERLFSMLDLTEHTMMELADVTLDQNVCELFTQLYLGPELCGCGEQVMASLDAFPAFSQMGARKRPRALRKAWRRLTPSRRRKALMLGCWAAICWRLVYVLLGSSAHSRPSTLLATRRCDLVKPAKGASPGRSKAKQNPAIRRRLLPNEVQQVAAETGLGTLALHQLRQLGASVDMARQC